jgi:hypothetical protein
MDWGIERSSLNAAVQHGKKSQEVQVKITGEMLK